MTANLFLESYFGCSRVHSNQTKHKSWLVRFNFVSLKTPKFITCSNSVDVTHCPRSVGYARDTFWFIYIRQNENLKKKTEKKWFKIRSKEQFINKYFNQLHVSAFVTLMKTNHVDFVCRGSAHRCCVFVIHIKSEKNGFWLNDNCRVFYGDSETWVFC